MSSDGTDVTSASLRAHLGRRGRCALLWDVATDLLGLEVQIRKRTIDRLCQDRGIIFSGFDNSVPPQHKTLSREVESRWWAVECVLRWWPWARKRPCLRRSMLLGAQLRHLQPRLCLEVVSTAPFLAHAVLVVHGHRLDMGEAGSSVTTAGSAS